MDTNFNEVFKTDHEVVCKKLEEVYKLLGEVLEKVKPKMVYVPYPVYIEKVVPWWEYWQSPYPYPYLRWDGEKYFNEYPTINFDQYTGACNACS